MRDSVRSRGRQAFISLETHKSAVAEERPRSYLRPPEPKPAGQMVANRSGPAKNTTPHESGSTRVPGVYFWNQHSLQLWKSSSSMYANASTLQLSFFRTRCTKVQTEQRVLPQIRLKVRGFLGSGESRVVRDMSPLTHADRHGRRCSWTEAAP